jgi:hypothetical protein
VAFFYVQAVFFLSSTQIPNEMKRFLTLLALIAAFTACKKDTSTQGPAGPQGPPGTTAAGTITGKVELYTDQNTPQTTDKGSVLVSIKGTTMSTLTDTTGKYTLNQVPAGIYTMVFSRGGYGVYEEQQISFPGNGKLYINAGLMETPKWKIIDLKITGTGQQINANYTLTPSATARQLLLIMGKKTDVDISNPLSFDRFTTINISAGQSQGYGYQYFNVSYPSGTVFYMKAYAYATNTPYYYDYETDKIIPAATGEPFSKVFPMIMP